jgi:hypothetical protein
MLEFYDSLIRDCRTINQANAVHIGLGNSMTPLELVELRKALVDTDDYWCDFKPDGASINRSAIRECARKWVQSHMALSNIDRDEQIEPFKRKFLYQRLLFYSDQSPPSNKTLLVCFAAAGQRMFMPTPVFLQYLPANATDVALLQDQNRDGYRGGLSGIGTDLLSLIDALPEILHLGDYRRICFMGASGGGLPAVIAAVHLGAEIGMWVGGNSPDDVRWSEPGRTNARELLSASRDSSRLTEIIVVYGAQCKYDEIAAQSLSRLVSTRALVIDDGARPVNHNALLPLAQKNQLRHFLTKNFRLEA